MVSVFWDFGRSNRCVVISYCYFNLHCPEDMWCRCRASFYILICYLLSWLVKILLRYLAHVLCCLFSYCFLFKNSLHILYVFYEIFLLQYFLTGYGLSSHSLDIDFYTADFFKMKSNVSIISFLDNAFGVLTKKLSL